MALSRVRLAGGEVEYGLLSGSGRLAPLVFLHEGLGSVSVWRDFPAEVCARSGRAGLVWSRHGYGGSAGGGVAGAAAAGAARRTVRYMHDEALCVLPELLDRLGIEVPVLVGHSDGASIALIHAGGSGRPVRAIVAMAPHVYVEAVSVAGIAEARRQYRTSDLRARLGRHHADVDTAFWGWNDIWLDPAFRAWNIEEYLPGVTCPVLCIQGADDEYGSLDQLDRIARGAAGPVSRLMFSAGGHGPQRSHPDEVAGAIARFVGAL